MAPCRVALLVAVECVIGVACVLWYALGGGSDGSLVQEARSPSGEVRAQVFSIRPLLGVDPQFRLVLRRDAGIVSRWNEVIPVGGFDADEVAFEDDDTILVVRGNTELRLHIDPESLDVMSTECDPAPVVSEWGEYTYDCLIEVTPTID